MGSHGLYATRAVTTHLNVSIFFRNTILLTKTL